jgi:uncharacterized protein (DUF2267 family)
MSIDFEKYASKGKEFITLVADDMKISEDHAGRIIRSVLHALRNRLPHEESFQLMAQLPMALKALYVDNWKFHTSLPRIRHVTEFFEEVRKEDGKSSEYDLGNDINTERAIVAVIRTLGRFVSPGEMSDIMAVLPAPLKDLIKNSIVGNTIIM